MSQTETFVKTELTAELSEYRNLFPDYNGALDPYEGTIVYSYTKQTVPPTHGYKRANDELRQGIVSEYSKLLDESLAKLPDHADIVFRGDYLDEKLFSLYTEAFLTNSPINPGFFYSSTKNARVAEHFPNSNVLVTIYSRTGKVIEGYSFFGSKNPHLNEEEVLFRYGTKFRILDIDFTNAPFTILMDEEE